MKKIILFLLLIPTLIFAQDLTEVSVNIRNNAKLQYGGVAVKQKFVLSTYTPVFEGSKEFVIRGVIVMYENVANAYGSKITDLIAADGTLSAEEKIDLNDRYRNKEVMYTTRGKFVDANGLLVASDAVGAQPELTYWQSFKMNNAGLGMTSASTQGALDGEYKIIIAIVTKMDARKNF